MKNKFIIFTIFLLIAVICFTFYTKNVAHKYEQYIRIESDNINYIEIQKQPHIKEITTMDDINKIIDIVNTLKLKKTEEFQGKGWVYWIKMYNKNNLNHSIVFLGNDLIEYNEKYYKIQENSKIIKQIENIYNNM